MRGGGAGARVVSQCLRRRDGGENAGGYRPFRGSDADSAAQGGCGERVSFGVEALIEIKNLAGQSCTKRLLCKVLSCGF